jgi:cytochrome c
MRRRRLLGVAGIAAVALGALLFAKARGYEPLQAERGARLYQQECADCHGKDLRGGSFRGPSRVEMLVPALEGPDRFPGLSAASQVFNVTESEMPLDEPGSLRAGDYLDLAAYLVSANKLAPPNGKPMTEDELSKIPIPRP